MSYIPDDKTAATIGKNENILKNELNKVMFTVKST